MLPFNFFVFKVVSCTFVDFFPHGILISLPLRLVVEEEAPFQFTQLKLHISTCFSGN